MSAYEAANGFSRPFAPGEKPISMDDELLLAHEELIARREMTQILRSHFLKQFDFKTGDLVQVYVRHSHQKRRKWLSSRQIISIDWL